MKVYKFYDKELDIYYDVEIESDYEEFLELIKEITGDEMVGQVQ